MDGDSINELQSMLLKRARMKDNQQQLDADGIILETRVGSVSQQLDL